MKIKNASLIIGLCAIFYIFNFNINYASAVGCQASCNNNTNILNCGGSLRCFYSGPHAELSNGGACSVGSSLAKCDPFVIFDANCSDANMSCKENNCSGLNAPDGTACKVVLGGWTGMACTETINNGTWDNTGKRCIECPSGKVWGDSTQVYYAGNPVDAAFCSPGTCTAVAPNVSVSPNTINTAGVTTVTINVTRNDNGATCISKTVPLEVSCTGGNTPSWASGSTAAVAPDGGTGNQTVDINAVATGTCTVTAKSPDNNALTSSATVDISIAACPAGFMVSFNGGGYVVGDQLEINYVIPAGFDGCVAVYTPSGTEDWSQNDIPGPHLAVGSAFATSAGVWKVTLSNGVGSCTSATACSGITTVAAPAACDNDGTCDAGESNATCPADCPAAACDNDGTCDAGEDSTSCPADCPAAACDNDGTCDAGEDSTSCPADCPVGGPFSCDPATGFFCNPLRGTVDDIVQGGQKLIGYVLGLIGSIALLFIVIAGMMYMTSAGNEERIASSKRILTGAIIGITIALLAYGFLQVIIAILNM